MSVLRKTLFPESKSVWYAYLRGDWVPEIGYGDNLAEAEAEADGEGRREEE